jgi:hypothetical protein
MNQNLVQKKCQMCVQSSGEASDQKDTGKRKYKIQYKKFETRIHNYVLDARPGADEEGPPDDAANIATSVKLRRMIRLAGTPGAKRKILTKATRNSHTHSEHL